MSKISPVLRMTEAGPAHWCPGCAGMHIFYTKYPAPGGARWTWDGNAEKPTFSPSMVISCDGIPDEGWPASRCHYFLRAGTIQFLADCTHELRGKTVSLPALPGAPA